MTLGSVIVSVASTTSVAMAFLIARYGLRDRVRGWIAGSPKLSAVDEAIGREGWKIVALLRLSPAVPFGLQSYVYGVTSMRLATCVLTSWVSMIPATVAYTYLGSVGADAVVRKEVAAGTWALRIVGLVATFAVTICVSRLAQRAIRSRMEPGSQDGDFPGKAVER